MTDRDALEALSSQELHDRAVRRAVRHLDIGFLWQLLREIPEGEAVAGHIDETAADETQLSAVLDDAFGHLDPGVADQMRPVYLDYLEKHGGCPRAPSASCSQPRAASPCRTRAGQDGGPAGGCSGAVEPGGTRRLAEAQPLPEAPRGRISSSAELTPPSSLTRRRTT